MSVRRHEVLSTLWLDARSAEKLFLFPMGKKVGPGRGEERARFDRPTGALYTRATLRRARRVEENRGPRGNPRGVTRGHLSRIFTRAFAAQVTMTAERESTRVFDRGMSSIAAPLLSGA